MHAAFENGGPAINPMLEEGRSVASERAKRGASSKERPTWNVTLDEKNDHLSRKAQGKEAVERRCNALFTLLNSDASTSKAEAFSTYENPLLILLEDPQSMAYLRGKEMKHGIVIE